MHDWRLARGGCITATCMLTASSSSAEYDAQPIRPQMVCTNFVYCFVYPLQPMTAHMHWSGILMGVSSRVHHLIVHLMTMALTLFQPIKVPSSLLP